MGQELARNTVGKGLVSDIDEQFQAPGTYRDIRNMRLVNNGGNNYALKSDEGMKLGFTIPPVEDAHDNASENTWNLVGWETYQDLEANNVNVRIVCLLKGTNDTFGSIYVADLDVTTGTPTFQKHYYTHKELRFSSEYSINSRMIKIVYETSNIVRVYFTDNNEEPRVYNLSLYNEFASGTLVTGVKYMVVGGQVEHPIGSGVYYGEIL